MEETTGESARMLRSSTGICYTSSVGFQTFAEAGKKCPSCPHCASCFCTSDFFRPKICPKKERKVCFSKIIDCHPSKYCSIFRLAFYMCFTPSGHPPKIYFQSSLLNLVNSKSITCKLVQKVKLLRIET